MRAALLTYNARLGDAIGQSVADKLTLFLDHHAEVRVFLEDDTQLHSIVRPHARRTHFNDGDTLAYLQSADLVVAEYGHYYPLLALLPALSGAKARVVIDYHGVTPPDLWEPGLREQLERGVRHRSLLWAADAVLVHSQFTLREVRDQLGYPEERIHQIDFPLDLNYFAPGRPEKDWRRELGLENAVVLLHVGRLAKNKRVPLLIEAVARFLPSPSVVSEPHTQGTPGVSGPCCVPVKNRLLREYPACAARTLPRERGEETRPLHLLIAGNDGEHYQAEADLCRRQAEELGVAERVHFLGQQTGAALRDLYRCANVLVAPSQWETFCLPVIEAMACGLPVLAARATALPETVGDAGVTFAVDDLRDLTRQLARALAGSPRPCTRGRGVGGEGADAANPPHPQPLSPEYRGEGRSCKVAVVAFRFGGDFVGGAETSLRTVAKSLRALGVAVEIFTTCVRSESDWRDELQAGLCEIDGLPARRFAIDAHDRPRHLETVRRILEGHGKVTDDEARAYLRHSIHSAALVEALQQRAAEFDAILVGPYLFGLTADVAQALPEKTLLVPCFHDEPLAHLPLWHETYGDVAGILWHSRAEQRFAEVDLGFNHPRSHLLGTLIDTDRPCDAAQSGIAGRYLVYCGRYTREKELPRLLDFMGQYQQRHPEHFRLVCMGQGPVELPRAPWCLDLGFVSDQRKRNVLAGADALVQLSRFESLSLVALEAFAATRPVIASSACPVLMAHLQQSHGGAAVSDFASFERTLNDLWTHPEEWRQRGEHGRAYVREHFGSRDVFGQRLQAILTDMHRPLVDCMRERGLARAQQFERGAWQTQFAALIENILEADPLPRRLDVEVKPRAPRQSLAPGSGAVLLPVQICNRGTQVLWPEGPARWTLRCQMEGHGAIPETVLPGPVAPGRTISAVAALPAPPDAGEYQGRVWLEAEGVTSPPALITVVVGGAGETCECLLHEVRAAVAEAHRVQQLPDDYHDVTHGVLAGVKRAVKSKLLGNFKHAYVDVLSRQQSACNAQLVKATAELAECCATLDHAVRLLNEKIQRLERKLKRARRKLKGQKAKPDL